LLVPIAILFLMEEDIAWVENVDLAAMMRFIFDICVVVRKLMIKIVLQCFVCMLYAIVCY
jgi:hypothetical protein